MNKKIEAFVVKNFPDVAELIIKYLQSVPALRGSAALKGLKGSSFGDVVSYLSDIPEFRLRKLTWNGYGYSGIYVDGATLELKNKTNINDEIVVSYFKRDDYFGPNKLDTYLITQSIRFENNTHRYSFLRDSVLVRDKVQKVTVIFELKGEDHNPTDVRCLIDDASGCVVSKDAMDVALSLDNLADMLDVSTLIQLEMM